MPRTQWRGMNEPQEPMSPPQSSLPYDRFTRTALQGILRAALAHVARHGLKPPHHFFINFDPHHDGARVPQGLRKEPPQELTIVLQHQFENLRVHETHFSVVLQFRGKPGALMVPFDAVTSFYDPGAQFGLRLTPLDNAQPFFAPSKSKHAPAQGAVGAQDKQDERRVVRLDAFRPPESDAR